MSVFDLFRGFFGSRGGRGSPEPFWGDFALDEEEEEEEEEEGDPAFAGSGSLSDGFSSGLQELLRDFHRFCQLESPHLGVYTLPPADQPLANGQSLRDSLLKYPDFHRPRAERGPDPPVSEGLQGMQPGSAAAADLKDSPKEDRDLDSQVALQGLGVILPPTQSWSYFKSVSVTKVEAPDGTVEERRTVRDSEGCEETVVTRSRRDSNLGLDQGQHREPRDPAPVSSWQDGDMSDTASIVNTFFRRWFPNW